MTRTEALALLNSLPRVTFVDFTFRAGIVTDHGRACVEHLPQGGVCLVGVFGRSKPQPDVRAALKEYLGGRELISHQHHN